MREIKFRAWDKKDKRWWVAGVDGDWFYRDGNEIKTVVGVELMQFTGLKDKNGVEIYEGDIVSHLYHKYIGFVEWNEKRAQFRLRENERTTDHLFQIDQQWYEVIGNIYSNPELLK